MESNIFYVRKQAPAKNDEQESYAIDDRWAKQTIGLEEKVQPMNLYQLVRAHIFGEQSKENFLFLWGKK